MPHLCITCKLALFGEPTSGLEPLSCSLRVIGQVLQGFARGCKSPISKGFSFSTLLSVAPYSVPGGIRLVSTEHSSFTIVLTRARFRSTPSTWPTHQHKAHSRALIPLDALDEPEHCRGMDEALGRVAGGASGHRYRHLPSCLSPAGVGLAEEVFARG